MLRLFVAVELPPEVKKDIAALCHDVTNARWVNPRQTHITLRFLGQTPDERLPEIREQLAHVRVPTFDLALHGTGVFPSGQGQMPPRVLWLGLEPAEPLQSLKQAIDHEFHAIGLDAHAKNKFSPHLTLARFRQPPNHTLAEFLTRYRSYHGTAWTIAHFALFKSTLLSSGAVHELVARYPPAALRKGE